MINDLLFKLWRGYKMLLMTIIEKKLILFGQKEMSYVKKDNQRGEIVIYRTRKDTYEVEY